MATAQFDLSGTRLGDSYVKLDVALRDETHATVSSPFHHTEPPSALARARQRWAFAAIVPKWRRW
jgi:hypothetical protein